MKTTFWAADSFRFCVTGRAAHHFLNRAAANGVRLQQVRCCKEGYSATAWGTDRQKLEHLAQAGGWVFTVTARHGPGRRLERLTYVRPGLAAGAALFCVLLQFFCGFVWRVDLGAMDQSLQPAMRQLLAGCGIYEGARLTKAALQSAQAQALGQSETFGWISLNFTGGCLSVESTPTQAQTVQEAPPLKGLYAKADGEILAVEIESGFAAVSPGQLVAAGQQLAAAEKLDRKGNAVRQGARGRVVARVQRQYTAQQPQRAEQPIFTGRSAVQQTLYLPGWSKVEEPEQSLTGKQHTDWLPLCLGRLALPASICRVTTWETAVQPLTYTADTAAALALRACRAALYADFPDAVITAEQRETTIQNGIASAAVTYIFTANIAAPP